MVSAPDDTHRFNGSDWQMLNRVVALARFQFTLDDEFDNNEARKCAYVAQHFTGPALDWVSTLPNQAAVFTHFDGFVEATRQAFGIADNNITALLRRDLDQLSWQSDVPIFFAEFDRLTFALGITSHETRVAMVEQKLPLAMKLRLAEQALHFANYDTMRERFNCMWAMDPTRGQATQSRKKPRCGNCGRQGHPASVCRSGPRAPKN